MTLLTCSDHDRLEVHDGNTQIFDGQDYRDGAVIDTEVEDGLSG